MPNWCLNKLTVSHTDPVMMDRFVNSYNAGTVCNEFIPKPVDIGDGWFDWCINNWGTKWDVGAGEDERYGLKATFVGNEACCSFDSAWSPPVGLYNKLVELGFRVHASYFEPGMAFCGTYLDGNDDYVDYSSKDMIPSSIWDDFGLENFFSEDE